MTKQLPADNAQKRICDLVYPFLHNKLEMKRNKYGHENALTFLTFLFTWGLVYNYSGSLILVNTKILKKVVCKNIRNSHYVPCV